MQTFPSDFGLISLVIPVHNEEKNITPLVSKIDAALKDYNYEIILINDGSTDNTQTQLQQLNHANVIIIELQKNYGQSIALAAGIDHAQGEYIVTLDGDLQNNPKDIPMMLQKAKSEQWDLVAGIRTNRKDSLLKTIPSKIANDIIRRTTKLDLKDYGCALKVLTKDTAKNLNLYDGMHRFINLLVHLNGGEITQVHVQHNARQQGVSKYGLGRTFKVIKDLMVVLTVQKSKQKPLSLFDRWLLQRDKPDAHQTLYGIKTLYSFCSCYKTDHKKSPHVCEGLMDTETGSV